MEEPERTTDFRNGMEMFEMNSLYTDLVLFVKLVSGGKEACDVFRHLHILLKDKNQKSNLKTTLSSCDVFKNPF